MKQKLTVMLALVAWIGLAAFSSPAEDWILLKEEGGVKVFYQLGSCDVRSVMFLKFENTLSSDVKVDFHMMMENNPPAPQRIEIKANQSIIGQCQGTPDLLKDVSTSTPEYHVTMKLIN